MIDPRLDPCPLCGGRANMWHLSGGVRIDCENWTNKNPDVHLVAIGAATEEEAIRKWNRKEKKK